MKIIFDGLIYYLQKQGGISRYFDELIEGFSNREDCEVIVLLRKNKIDKVFTDKVKLEIIDSTIHSENKIKKYISVFRDKYAVNRFLKQNDLSGAVFHYSYYTFYKNLKAKSVVTVHDLVHEKFPNFFGGILNKIYLLNKNKSILKADNLIAISEQTKNDLVEVYGIKQEKIDVVYHGLNKKFRIMADELKSDFLKKKNIGKPFFLFVGNRSLYKNFNFLLTTFSSWERKEEFDIYCVGGGEFTSEENILIKKLNLTGKIKLIIFATEDDLVGFYNCSTALIYPSLYEGFGFPILEGLACGVKVLASDIPVFREIGGDLPIYFNPYDSKSLIKALNLSLSDGHNRVSSGLEWVKKFSWENTISKTLQVYKK